MVAGIENIWNTWEWPLYPNPIPYSNPKKLPNPSPNASDHHIPNPNIISRPYSFVNRNASGNPILDPHPYIWALFNNTPNPNRNP